MRKSNKILITSLAILLSGALVLCAVSWANSVNALGEYRNQLNYVYRQNFYELTDNINDIETNLGKVSVSTNNSDLSRYMSNIASASSSAQSNITELPIDHNTIDNTITFINQLNGYVYTLQTKLSTGEGLTLDDYDQIESLHSSSEDIKYELNKLSVLISSGDYEIIDNIQDPNITSNQFSESWSGLNNQTIEYPTLIYDGPFSESTTNKTIRGLSENQVSDTQARVNLSKVFTDYTIEYTGEVTGAKFDVYNFELTKDDIIYYAQVSKRDGILLQLNSNIESTSRTIPVSDAEVLAEEFATSLGFQSMKAVWSTSSNNFAYVNLTPVQNDIILYPDLIKVKISQSSGKIVGWEAKSWAYNHTQRNNLTPSIDLAKATMSVASNMDIRSTRLCVIPGNYVGELLAYEFMCAYSGATYYIYIDATTGQQCNVLKVIETDDGNLLM
ncbi:MAG: germination protein YpeB [Clostridia bacterium]|nr:germination protein YpeB [Clostridia bacterium]